MNISDLTETKIVRRPYTDEFGNRKLGVEEFEVKYNYKIENDSFRILAKVIDIVLVALFLHYLALHNIISIASIIYIFPIFFILLNSILESLLGSSLGKLLLNIAVVNEKAEYLSFFKSLHRNTVIVANILVFAIVHSHAHFFWEFLDKKYRDYNIYIIARRKRKEIKRMLNSNHLA